MMTGYLTSDLVRRTLNAGIDVVVESYFYRTHATHAATGVEPLPPINWTRAVVPDLAVELVVDENVRRSRLGSRGGSHGGRWSEIQEANSGVLEGIYRSFGLTRLDATHIGPKQVADRIADLAQKARKP